MRIEGEARDRRTYPGERTTKTRDPGRTAPGGPKKTWGKEDERGLTGQTSHLASQGEEKIRRCKPPE